MPEYVAVIGAGVNGLSTAVQIQETYPSAKVTIIADKFERDTVSDGAAGSFRPTMDYIPGVPRYLLKQWCEDSWAFYTSLCKSVEASEAGVGIISGYHFFTPGQQELDPLYREIVYQSRDLVEKDFETFPGTEACKSGFFTTTLIVECRWYLPWLMKWFRRNGGLVEQRVVHSLEELCGKYDVIVNCAGARASHLVEDDKLIPTRGQMIRVKAPWIKHFVYVDHNCWIIPGKETVIVGGTRQFDNKSLEISEADSKEVWERACRYVPSLRKAEWLWEWVGMRPIRKPVRVDREMMTFGKKTIAVVHNYGQGGNGVSLSWGCSKHAARLVCEALSQRMHKL